MSVPSETTATELKIALPFGVSVEEARLLLAIKLFELGCVSIDRAARLAGFSLRAFIDVLGQHRVPVLNYSPESLQQELE